MGGGLTFALGTLIALLPMRRAVLLVALLNLAYFGIQVSVALTIGAVSLFAGSIDFLEDAAVNLLILVVLGWPARQRALVGMLLAAILLVPSLATLWTAWQKFNLPIASEPLPLSLTGFGALVINLDPNSSGCVAKQPASESSLLCSTNSTPVIWEGQRRRAAAACACSIASLPLVPAEAGLLQ